MSDGAMAPVPADHPLMIAWKAYQETEDFKNTFKWATSAILISTKETAPEANRVDPAEQRERRAMGTLWGAFMAGFNVTTANAVAAERAACANIALAIDSGRGNEKEIAKAILMQPLTSTNRTD